MTLISVIVPVYNEEKLLKKCVESIVNQTYENKEIILVDDGSIDGSSAICDDLSKSYGFIRVIHKQNGGLVSAREVGIRECMGEYFTFLDADDFFDVDCLERISQEIKLCPDIIFYGITDDIGNRRIVRKNHIKEGFYDRKKLEEEVFPYAISSGTFFDFGIIPSMGCKAIKRSFYEKADIRVSNVITVGEDVDYSLQCLLKAQSASFIDFAPYHYYKHEGTMMHTPLKKELVDALRKDLENAISESGFADILKKQLEDYLTFLCLLKCAENVPWLSGLLEKYKRVALYGAGGFGEEVFLKYKENISVWVDANYERFKGSDLPVESKQALFDKQDSYDCVLIAILNSDTCKLVERELIEEGIKKPIFYYS